MGPDIPDAFENTLIFHNLALSNPSNMEIGFFDHTNEKPILVLNEGAPDRASIFNRSLLIGKNKGAGPFDEDYTLAEGFKYADFDTPTTGADLGVEDDIEAKGSIYTQENLQVDIDANIDGALGVGGAVTIEADPYDSSWDGLQQAASKDAVYNKIEGLSIPIDISCKVTKSANQTIPYLTVTLLSWNQETYDTDDMHDDITNNSQIYISTTGKYSSLLQTNWDSDNTGRRIFILVKNELEISRLEYKAETTGNNQFNWTGELEAGDVLTMHAWQNISVEGNLNFIGGASTYFEVHKIN